MNFSSRVPATEASGFPVNEPHYFVIVDYDVGLGKVVVHEAQVRVGVGAREDNTTF